VIEFDPTPFQNFASQIVDANMVVKPAQNDSAETHDTDNLEAHCKISSVLRSLISTCARRVKKSVPFGHFCRSLVDNREIQYDDGDADAVKYWCNC
jgi:hypothetical protein